MRPAIQNSRYVILLVCILVQTAFIGWLFGDQFGPHIGYLADVRYDAIIQRLLFRAAMEYERARTRDPDSAIAHNNLGVVYRIKSELDKAETEFNKALNKDEKFAGARMNLGVVYAAQGKIDEAIAAHLKAQENAPTLLQPQIYYNLGSLYDEKGEFAKALEEYNKVKSHQKTGRELKAKAHVAAGVVYAKQEDYDLAKKEFEIALALAPNSEAGILAEQNLTLLPSEIATFIKSVAVTGSPATLGGVIHVTVEGVAGATVTFSIGEIVSDVEMEEERPGVYTGQYVVSEPINVEDAPVIITLIDASTGKTRTDTSQSLTIDTEARIESVSVKGSAIKVRDTLLIIARAEPRADVNFSIAGLVTDVPMPEREKGKYVGTYTVKDGDAAPDATVTVNLTDRAGNTTSDTSQKVTVTSRRWTVTFVNHAEEPIQKGEVFDVDIVLTDGANVFGFQLDVAFNPKVLTAQEVVEGDFLKGDGSQTFWRSPAIDNDNGLITGIMAVRQGTSVGLEGGGLLASIRFSAKARGVSPVTFQKASFSTPSGQQLTGIITQNGSVAVETQALTGDVNNDGAVDVSDLVIVGQHFGESAANAPRADVNGDGEINILDLVLVGRHFGKTTNAAPSQSAWVVNSEYLPILRKINSLIEVTPEDTPELMALQQLVRTLISQASSRTPQTVLLQNYPNPFNPETWIPYQLSSGAVVEITIHDAHGNLIRRLDLGYKASGSYLNPQKAAHWDGRNEHGERVASGVYYYTLRAGKFVATKRFVVKK